MRWCAWVAVVVMTVAGAVAARGAEKVGTVEGITEYRLGNGARVVLFPDVTRPMVTVNMTIFVGSRHEGYGETGMAHLLEHMLFKGTPVFPDPKKEMDARGARWNGTTWFDRTNYFETLVASDENLEFALKFEADRLVNCPIEQEDLASEFSVVRNEFESGENDPGNVLNDRVISAMYLWHNYGKTTIGNRSDIERVPVEKLRAFYKKYYRPDNVMVVVAGRFDEKKAVEWAEKYFGALKNPEGKVEATYTEEPPQDGERLVTLRRVGEVGIVEAAYHVPAGGHEDFAAVSVLTSALTDSPSGELYKALVETKKAVSVGGWAAALHDPGFVDINATVRAEGSLDEVKQIMLGVIDRVAKDGVSAEQVERAKRRFAAERKRQLVDPTRVAVDLSNWAAQGDWRLYFLYRDRMEKVTPEDVKRVAGAYLRASNRTVGMFIPTKEPERTPVPPKPDVTAMLKDYKGREAVAAGEQLDPDPMKIEARVKYPGAIGGVKVALLPKKTRQEMVIARVTLRYGDAESLKGYRVAGQMLPDLMARGTKKLSRQQLNDELDAAEARLSAGADGVGAMTFSVQAPRANLAKAMGLLRQVMREPALSSEEFEVLKRERLAGQEEALRDPGSLASNALSRKLSKYPKGDVRYVPTIAEGIEDTKAVKVEQLRELYEKFVGNQAGEAVAVGEFEEGEMVGMFKEVLSGWEGKAKYERVAYEVAGGTPGAEEIINTPDKENALYVAGVAIPMSDEDPEFAAVRLAGYTLGGGTSGRLFVRVREKDGLSYGAYAGVSGSSVDKYTQVRLNVIYNPTNAAKVRAAVAEEVERFAEKGVEPDELARNKEAMLKEWTMGRSQERTLVTMLARNLFAGRTMAFEADMEKKIREMTVEQVAAAAKKYFVAKGMWVVTAGDFNKGATTSKAGG